MCAILDTNAAHEVFGGNAGQATEAGKEFFEWLSCGKGNLVVGGQLGEELDRVPGFRKWAYQSKLQGKPLVKISDYRINDETKEIQKRHNLKSNDLHIIALAHASGARLLFSNDENLHKDFKNPAIINGPRGKVYSTSEDKSFTEDKRRLLTHHRCRSHK